MSAFSRLVCGILMIIIYASPKSLKLTGIKVLTWLFFSFYLLDLITIVGTVIARWVYLVLESDHEVFLKERKPIKLSLAKKVYDPQSIRGGGKKPIHKSNKVVPLS